MQNERTFVEKLLRAGIILSALVMLCGFYLTGRMWIDHIRLNSQMEELRKTWDKASQATGENDGEGQGEEAAASKSTVSPYENLFALNEDMVGWLKVPGTYIDYPVMQTMEDEEYYLRRDFYGDSNQNGCLFMDTESNVELPSTNLLIHGHNRLIDDMFGTLSRYEEEDFAKENSKIYFYTKDDEKTYQVMAVFRSRVYQETDHVFKYYEFFQADSQEEFDDFYNNVKELSLYDTGVEAEFGDHFITLSTCSYYVGKGRFVVVGKQVG